MIGGLDLKARDKTNSPARNDLISCRVKQIRVCLEELILGALCGRIITRLLTTHQNR